MGRAAIWIGLLLAAAALGGAFVMACAVIAMRENAHLGLDSLVRVLPLLGKKACFALSNVLMLVCCVLMFYGTWKQHSINATTMSPVVELPMSWVYGVGYIASVAMGLTVDITMG